jgi:glycosyltransferase involved in cell wall biosynthesis
MPGDIDALAEKIELLLGNSELRREMGAAGEKFVETLSPESVAEKWEKVYGDAVRSYK